MGTLAVGSRDATLEAAQARIGPNAVLQTLAAAEALEGRATAARIRTLAALPEDWSEGLIPEAWFLSTLRATRATLPTPRADAVLREAGTRTAAYVAEHRIPRAFRALLRTLPARVALPMLLTAFARHAWTFAGRGRFSVEGAYPGAIRLEDAPTCRERAPTPDALTGGYYEAAFEALLSLAAPGVRVREIACASQGKPACIFQIALGPVGPREGEP